MRRIFASTLLALGLTGGVAAASPYHHDFRGGGYRDARVTAFHRGFERGRWGGGGYGRPEMRRDWRFHDRGWRR
jgi:hypothetical protein